jgi:3-methyladenine DNA glycosylase AlkD
VNADAVRAEIDALADPERAAGMARYFKSGRGQYGEGDVFAGVSMPDLRRVVRRASLDLAEISTLLGDAVHEHRMVAVLLLAEGYARAGDDPARAAVVETYLNHTARVNNWDLVDASAEFIVGPWWRARGAAGRRARLGLVRSESLWERRIAVLSTFHDIKIGDSGPALEVCALEVCALEVCALEVCALLPRTMLRYAIEHLSPDVRAHYLAAARAKAARGAPIRGQK